MFCPNCRAEYRPGFTECFDCGVALLEELPEEQEPEVPTDSEPELVEVYRSGNLDADSIRQLLEGSGIPATLTWPPYGGQYPVHVGGLGESGVMVRASDRDAALEVIRAALQGELQLDETGPEAD